VTFPVYIPVFGFRVHPHLVMELIGYACGFQLYLFLRRRARRRGEAVPGEAGLWLIVGCVLGAMVGSKILAWAESFNEYWAARGDVRAWLGGKTIVGGLLGGWIGVEIVKKRFGIRRSTGDLFVFPLIVGMNIGRVGCFLTGLSDHTCGVATSLPWGVDFGDGVRRHPTQLYDIVVLMFIGIFCLVRMRRPWAEGRMFRLFMQGYLAWRFAVEFIKPREIRLPWLDLSAIQIAALAGTWICAWMLLRSRRVNFRRDGSTG
jgi:phosphatidylglycerol:prolipoprotein diacylglycerol transferase